MTHASILRPAALAALGFAAVLAAGCADMSGNRAPAAGSGDYSRSSTTGSGAATSGTTPGTPNRTGPGTQGPSGTSGTAR